MAETGRKNSRLVKGVVLAALVAAVAVVAWIRVTETTARMPEPVSRDGMLYAGIPARVEFVPFEAAASPDVPWKILADVGTVFNAFDPQSELGKLNATPGTGEIEVSRDLGDAIGQGIGISQVTRGAFDLTIRPLKTLWKRAADTGNLPTDYEITAAVDRVGWGYVSLVRGESNAWRVSRAKPGMELDLGGIVKGWSVDKAVDWLTDRRVKSALVQVGGEIGLIGDSAVGRPWRIGIRHPLDGSKNWTVLSLTGRVAVSTSGNYEQPVQIGGTDYYHIFDPVTGRPVSTDILGVTVVVTSGQSMNARADGLATAFAVMGVEKSLELAATMPGVEVLFIVRDATSGQPTEKTTPNFNRLRAGQARD